MCPKRTHTSLKSVLGYSAPVYHEKGSKVYVDFYIRDPYTGDFRRKKYHLDSIKNRRARQKMAADLIAELTAKLSKGWNPFAESDNSRACAPIDDTLDLYLKSISKDCRKKTVHSYTSHVNVLREFFGTLPNPPIYCYQFTKDVINDFLDYVYFKREVGPNTRNNYLAWCFGFCEWMRSRNYIDSNPAEGIAKSKKKIKKRQPLSAEMLARLREELLDTEPYFLLACMFEYYCFIRPTELTNLRVRDINLMEQSVSVSGEYSKNKKDGKAAIPDSLGRLLIDLHTFDKPGEYYLFSTGFKPGKKQARADIFNKRWAQLRARLHWGDEYQFYSLKDTGIRDLANSEGIVVARDQARHSDVSTTNKYLQGDSLKVHEESKRFEGLL